MINSGSIAFGHLILAKLLLQLHLDGSISYLFGHLVYIDYKAIFAFVELLSNLDCHELMVYC